jgi:hypothetical protein
MDKGREGRERRHRQAKAVDPASGHPTRPFKVKGVGIGGHGTLYRLQSLGQSFLSLVLDS